MPDAPGSGPTDPDHILRAIALGADWHKGNMLRLRDGSIRWLAVADTPGSGPTDPDRYRWVLTVNRGVKLDRETFEALTRATQLGDALLIDGKRWALVAPHVADRQQLARLMPA